MDIYKSDAVKEKARDLLLELRAHVDDRGSVVKLIHCLELFAGNAPAWYIREMEEAIISFHCSLVDDEEADISVPLGRIPEK